MSPYTLDDIAIIQLDGGRFTFARFKPDEPKHERVVFVGRVFFDHVTGVRSMPKVNSGRFALIEYWEDFDWTAQHDIGALVRRCDGVGAAGERRGLT